MPGAPTYAQRQRRPLTWVLYGVDREDLDAGVNELTRLYGNRIDWGAPGPAKGGGVRITAHWRPLALGKLPKQEEGPSDEDEAEAQTADG